MNTERKCFGDLLQDENLKAFRIGKEIFFKLKQLYPENNVQNLDLILNTLCASLVCLIAHAVNKDNYSISIQLVHKILTRSLIDSK